MGLTAKEPENDYQLLPEAVHHAICIWIFDIGTQYSEKWDKEIRKVIITWEIPEELMSDGRPMVTSREYTLSLHVKAQLRKDLEAWRGKAFTKEELEGFDIKKVLGANCQIQIIHNEINGKTYSNIASIMALPKGMNPSNPKNELRFFSFEEKAEIPDDIPAWIMKKIETSKEYKQIYLGNPETAPTESTELEPF